MSNEKADGGPAFPQHDLSGYGMGPAMRGFVPGDEMSGRYEVEGMSLRDWFAGQALGGLLAGRAVLVDPEWNHLNGEPRNDRMADVAYAYADAMLAERSK